MKFKHVQRILFTAVIFLHSILSQAQTKSNQSSSAFVYGKGSGGNGSDGTFSWGGYFNTSYFTDPEEQIMGILLKQTQYIKSGDTGWKFPILVGQSIGDYPKRTTKPKRHQSSLNN